MQTNQKINILLNTTITGLVIILFLAGFTAYRALRPSPHNQTTEQIAQEFAQKCRQLNFREPCYTEAFKTLSKKADFVAARAVLMNLQKIDNQTTSCHTIAHIISLAAVEKDPENWKSLLKEVNPQECGSGFFHGILEGHTRYAPNFAISGMQIEKLCDDSSPYVVGSCVHIMGHLSLVQTSGDVPQAMTICQQAKPELQNQCFSGVFMENMTKQVLIDHGIVQGTANTPPQEPTAKLELLCRAYTGSIANACWGEMGYRYASQNNNDSRKAYASCSQSNNKDWTFNCFIHAAVGVTMSHSANPTTENVCHPLAQSTEQYQTCLSQVIDAMMQNSLQFFSQAVTLCNSSGDSNCLENLAGSMGRYFHTPEAIDLCKTLPEKYQINCLSSNNQGNGPQIFIENGSL